MLVHVGRRPSSQASPVEVATPVNGYLEPTRAGDERLHIGAWCDDTEQQRRGADEEDQIRADEPSGEKQENAGLVPNSASVGRRA